MFGNIWGSILNGINNLILLENVPLNFLLFPKVFLYRKVRPFWGLNMSQLWRTRICCKSVQDINMPFLPINFLKCSIEKSVSSYLLRICSSSIHIESETHCSHAQFNQFSLWKRNSLESCCYFGRNLTIFLQSRKKAVIDEMDTVEFSKD